MTLPYFAYVIDDDREMRQSLTHLLTRAGFRVSPFSDATIALGQMSDDSPEVILSDVRMPRMSGLELLAELTRRSSAPPLVLISAHGDIPTAVQAIQDGAHCFLEKPYDPRRLIAILSQAAEKQRLLASAQRMASDLSALSGLNRVLLGAAAAIAEIRQDLIDIAPLEASVLITGDTGTGKEVVARALHNLGPNRAGPFVAVNCATIAPEGFEERVFGTADGDPGLIRSADGGTLFLDEVAACPEGAQAKLLRVLETGEVRPLGSGDEVSARLRVVAASNECLEDRVADGSFRPDLLFRLNTFVLHLPPLRDRGDDVLILFETFVDQLSQTYEITAPQLTADDAAALLAHDWPGNVRELRNVAERRVLSARRGGGSVAQALRLDAPEEVPETLREAVASFERTLIAKAVKAHQGRMDAVAEALGIGRRTLNEKIVKLGLDKSRLLD